MARKVKVPERPEDCKTLLEKIAYSNAMRERWESVDPDAPPSEIFKFPMPDPAYPWAHPEWAAHYAQAELKNRREQRKLLQDLKKEPRITRKRKAK
jgi:hypothetical protein